MKKHLIAAAVAAAVAVPAMAQVTISGTLDVVPHSVGEFTVGTTTSKLSGTGNDNGTSHSGTNRMNFNFTEDLGGGLKVTGLYRLRVIDDGSSGGADDYSLRVTGDFGALRVGRFSGFVGGIEAMSGAFAATNVGGIGATGANLVGGTMQTNAKTITAATGALVSAAGTTGAHDDTQGLVQYVSPTFSGLNVTLDYQNRTSDESTTAGNGSIKQQGIGLSYTAGPLTVQAATSTRDLAGVFQTSEGTNTTTSEIKWLAASYNMGPATFYLGTAKREELTAVAVTSDDVSITTAGVQYQTGAVTLYASMYDGDDGNTGVAGAAATETRDLAGRQIAVKYALSKRTSAYFSMGVNEDKGSTANTNFKSELTALGLRHDF